MRRYFVPLAAALAALAATPVLAHTGEGGAGIEAGFSHPFAGADHLLAAIAVGLWSAQLGGRAAWGLPALFLAMMIGGGAIGLYGIAPFGADILTLSSVVLLGGAVALAARPAVLPGAMVVGAFALAHGFAHGAEALAATGGGGFLVGLVWATALLHGVGFVGHAGLRRAGLWAVRTGGASIAVVGLGLAVLA